MRADEARRPLMRACGLRGLRGGGVGDTTMRALVADRTHERALTRITSNADV
jgi:hypothetical protein